MFRNVYISRTILLCLCSFISSGYLHANEHEESKKLRQVPFQIVQDLIVVKATCNGNLGNYIFDTGATDLILNQAADLTETALGDQKDIVGVFDVNMKSTSAAVKEFRLGQLIKENFQTSSLDLGHIEKALNTKIDGLIGMGFFNEYNLLIDYSNQSIGIYESKDDVEKLVSALSPLDPIKIDYQMTEGLPTIDCFIGDEKLHLGLDFGSSITILDETYSDELSLAILETIQLNGSAENKSCEKHVIRPITIKGNHLLGKSEALFINLDHLRDASIKIDGIIGVDLIKNKIVLIEGKENRLKIWDASFTPSLAIR